MRYTRKALRAIDMFALILVGIGALFLVIGALGGGGAGRPMAARRRPFAKGEAARVKGGGAFDGSTGLAEVKHSAAVLGTSKGGGKSARPVSSTAYAGAGYAFSHGYRYGWMLLGAVFAALGAALNLGLRRVLRNDCEDVVAPHDEPEEVPATGEGRALASEEAEPASDG